jgi:hypothetical protein
MSDARRYRVNAAECLLTAARCKLLIAVSSSLLPLMARAGPPDEAMDELLASRDVPMALESTRAGRLMGLDGSLAAGRGSSWAILDQCLVLARPERHI